jgi:hypothetical protein
MKFLVFILLLAVGMGVGLQPTAAQSNSAALSYFGEGTILFRLPTSYGITSEPDTTRYVIAYSERFTVPASFTSAYLDSVVVSMDIDTINPAEGIAIEALPVYSDNGALYVDVNGLPYGNVPVLDTSNVPLSSYHQLNLYSFSMGNPLLDDTDFFLSVSIPDTAVTVVGLLADSVTSIDSLPFDANRDRSTFLLNAPYGVPGFYQNYLYATQFTKGGLYYYPNFDMIAYVSSPTGSVAELYPADQDPLAFYVELTAAGATNLYFTTQDAGSVQLDLFDASGKLVSTLFEGGYANGQYEVPLSTSALASGMYFARLTDGNSSEVRRVMVAH